MKKYGKFGKGMAPIAAAKSSEQKPPKVKNMLLQTYFTGLICLILSVGMFLGTSYAWFTSEVTNTANEIYVGTLKVGLYKETDAGNKNLATDNVKLFDDSIRWEPGYTNLETIQVVNEGDLAFQYVLTFFTDGSVDGANLYDVAQHFDVCVYNHHNKQDPNPASFDKIIEDDNWDKVGTLAQVLNGKVVLSGNMVRVREDGQDAAVINSGTTDGLRTTDRYTIALHMKESATSAVMGRKINLSVKLVAYQKAQETDDMGTTYDSGISVATDVESLTDALGKGGHVLLASNITLTNDVALGTATLDGNGHRITKEGSSVAAVIASGGKISNLTIADRALQVNPLSSDLVVTNCTLNGTCSLNLGDGTKGDVYFTNCTFDDEALNVSALNEGTTITLTNCTYDGHTINKATITSSGATGGLQLVDNKVVLDSNS